MNFITESDTLSFDAIYELHKKEKRAKFYKKVGHRFTLTSNDSDTLKFMSTQAPKWYKINLISIPVSSFGTVWVAKKV